MKNNMTIYQAMFSIYACSRLIIITIMLALCSARQEIYSEVHAVVDLQKNFKWWGKVNN